MNTQSVVIEKWRPIAGFEDFYEVSNFGRVKSIDRKVGLRRLCERVLSGSIKSNGYVLIALQKPGEKRVARLAHRLVAIAFLNQPAGKTEINHLDLNKTNNIVSNLEWSTRKLNMRHAAAHGAFTGTVNPRRGKKISVEIARTIRKEMAAGVACSILAARFAISKSAVYQIVQGRIWR